MRALAFALVLLAAGCSPSAPDETSADYRELKDARIHAHEVRDSAFFDGLLADDFRGMDSTGAVLDKASYLDLEFGPGRTESITSKTEVSDFTAQRTGDTLVMTYTERVTNTVGTQDLVERARRLDVYVLQAGKWRLLAMTGAHLADAPPVVAIDAAQLAEFAGTYEFGPNTISRVWVDGDHLAEQSTGQPQTRMMPMGPDLFFDPDNLAARVSFTRDAKGRVVAQVYQSGGQSLTARRIAGAN